MDSETNKFASEFNGRFKVFHELMSVKVREIMVVSSPYDAFILEEDGSLASRIINEYSGLNLSIPPRVTRASSAAEALDLLKKKTFDLVITMPHVAEMDACSLGIEIKKIIPDLPVILLGHNSKSISQLLENKDFSGIDKTFVWTGNSDLLLAIVKNAEDHINAARDTERAMVRVLILVEDSPVYRSSFLPLIYKEIVRQIQSLLELGINEEHRLLLMRARPKILLAENYEQAMELYKRFHPYLFGIISDARLPKNGVLNENAGIDFLSCIRKEIFDLPLLLLSSEPCNREKAEAVPAVFLDKNSANFMRELHDFFLNHLGFGDFVFRMPDGTEIDRCHNLKNLIEKLPDIPDESLCWHSDRNHFSNWIMSRSEIALASEFRKVKTTDFNSPDELRNYIISNVRALLVWLQKGEVVQFKIHHFDVELMDFIKIGCGSLGGKARGLAFMSALLQENPGIHEKYSDINITIPKTLAVTIDGFEDFVDTNNLRYLGEGDFPDKIIAEKFLQSQMPEYLFKDLEVFLSQVNYPLSIRSSSRLEDAHFQPYAGLYETYMLPNNHPDFSIRLNHLVSAVKLVYASTYYEGPRAFSKNTSNPHSEESMGVIIQQMTGNRHGDYYYPDISGVAQSYNFYPVSHMKHEEGIAHIALGLGKIVVEGGRTLRFSPKYPNILPQFSVIDDILSNAQRKFYALKIKGYPESLHFQHNSNLEKRDIDDAENEPPVQMLSSTYIPDEHRIRDSSYFSGPKILTFAQVLKYKCFPLPELLTDLLGIGRDAMGCPVEIEFAVNLSNKNTKNEFFFLQIRPMVANQEQFDVQISSQDIQKAFCYSTQTLGNGKKENITDIIYVKPDEFAPESTTRIVEDIGSLNTKLLKDNRPYILVGPGRWGTSDPWLGIPVQWHHISGVEAIIEIRNEKFKVEPSQGSHFFQNITSLGIFYITITEGSQDHLDWNWLNSIQAFEETKYLRHICIKKPIIIKVDGRTSRCVIINNL